jgi:hypothetical protein
VAKENGQYTAVYGRGRGELSKVDVEDARGISGGAAIFLRAMPSSSNGDRDDAVADDAAVERAAARIAALRSREAS